MLRIGAELRTAARACVLLHGRAREPEEMVALAERLDLADTHAVVPRADGLTWYPQSFLVDRADNEPRLSHALATVAAQVAQIETARPGLPVAVIGFSQGACLAAEFAYRYPGRVRGLVAFTGGLVGPPGTSWGAEERQESLRAFFGVSERDAWVPAYRVRESASVFGGLGAQVDVLEYEGGTHIISDAEIERARDLLASL